MDIETLLRDTFDAHEHHAPDEREVLDAVRRRTAQHPARAGHTRLLAVAASVTVVAGAAVAVTVATRGHDPHAAPAGTSAPATTTTDTHPPPRRPRTAPSATRARRLSRIAPLTMPFDLQWLPTGSKQWIARRVNVGGTSDSSRPLFDGEYMLNITTSAGPVFVDVQQMPGGLQGSGFKSGAGRAVTVGGNPGIESVHSGGPGGYELYFKPAGHPLLYVNVGPVNGSKVSAAARWTSIGRQIAAGVRIPGTTKIAPTFGVGYVPAGLEVRAFDVDAGAGGFDAGGPAVATSYELGTATSQDMPINVGTNLAGAPTGAAGRTVQGHRTKVEDDHGYRTVTVLDAVHGAPVAISGRVPLAELYRVADGLVLP